MRNPCDIIHNGKTLPEILDLHGKWLRSASGGERANLSHANLSHANLFNANLSHANLSDANLWGTIGNMKEIKSLQIDTWPIAYTADILQIGCQHHPIQSWRDATPDWIAAKDRNAMDGWAKFGPTLLQIIDLSPATPTQGVRKGQ